MKSIFLPFLLFVFHCISAQEKEEWRGWHHKDLDQDKYAGISTHKAYAELLKDKISSRTIIVAILDGGTDINHEDLKGKIWINQLEIPNNGIDDDGNGYIDDIHGWNFLGNNNGENIGKATLECTRLFRKCDSLYINKTESEIPQHEKALYAQYLKAKSDVQRNLKTNNDQLSSMLNVVEIFNFCDSIIVDFLGDSVYTVDELKSIKVSKDSQVDRCRDFMVKLMKGGVNKSDFNEYMEHLSSKVNYQYNVSYNDRLIIGDDYENNDFRFYGNNDVIGSDADHGTMTAGVIAAVRNNGIGIEGIATNVQCMILRCVPDGDEYDKDVANAIRYAAENGAHIINMSFGKSYSPQKQFVDEAIRFAMSKNVLMIHSAGNDSYNLDTITTYPDKKMLNGDTAQLFISVGASDKWADKKLPAYFSNYSKNVVDIFAPGMDIYTCKPGNKYENTQGTSFSGPVVSGVAALLMSYYPQLSPIQIKDIILRSATTYPKLKVYIPHDSKSYKIKGYFSSLSRTGAVVNIYEAVKLAEMMTK